LFQVKICGITNVEDALIAADAGADAIGLNFFSESSRYISFETAGAIVEALRALPPAKQPQVVGVFVNGDPSKIFEAMALLRLNAVQLHGDEPPEAVAALSGMSNLFSLANSDPSVPSLTVLRAFRCRDEGLATVSEYLCQCEAMRPASGGMSTLPHAVLLDAYTPGAYGGTGNVVDWAVVRADRELVLGLPIVLAGGLTADNVAEAIAKSGCDAVDTASGVEDSPGRKNEAKVRAFVTAAKAALDSIKSLAKAGL
jgi:phosphoribosylanthranilate isomerase